MPINWLQTFQISRIQCDPNSHFFKAAGVISSLFAAFCLISSKTHGNISLYLGGGAQRERAPLACGKAELLLLTQKKKKEREER